MHSEEDSAQAKVILTSETVVPDLRTQPSGTTKKEKISVYFTIAAAAFGFVSDGCKSHCAGYPTAQCAHWQGWCDDAKMIKIRKIS